VVLTNEDLARVMKYVDVSRTPIVIGQAVQWVDPRRWESDRESFLAAFNRWKVDWESMDTGRYLANYSRDFHGIEAWAARKKRVAYAKSWIKVGVSEMSVFAYPGQRDLMMVTFDQDYRSNNMSKRTHKQQFWSREGGRWRIVHEAVVS